MYTSFERCFLPNGVKTRLQIDRRRRAEPDNCTTPTAGRQHLIAPLRRPPTGASLRAPHLSRLDDVVEGFDGLLDRGAAIPAMDLVEVDVVGAESAQAGIDLGEDRLARQPGGVVPASHGREHLRGDHHLVAAREVRDRAPDDRLARAEGVGVGGVEEVDAVLDRLPEERSARLFVQRPGVGALIGCTEAHAAQAQGGYIQSGPSELHILHRALCGSGAPRGAYNAQGSQTRRAELPGRLGQPALGWHPTERSFRQ